MKFLVDSYKNNGKLHHAYAFEGGSSFVLKNLKDFFENELGETVQGNPDFVFEEYETFGIDDARSIIERQFRKSFSGSKKLFIISWQSITSQAQNALLKVFEEPTVDTHFFLIMRSFDILLPTLKSRISFVPNEAREGRVSVKEKGDSFLALSISERLSLLSQIIEEKNKKEALLLLDGVEESLHELLKNKKDKEKDKNIIFSLGEILLAKQYLEDTSPSVKLLLEHIAHITPTLVTK